MKQNEKKGICPLEALKWAESHKNDNDLNGVKARLHLAVFKSFAEKVCTMELPSYKLLHEAPQYHKPQ